MSLGNALATVFSAPPYQLSGLSLGWILSGVFLGAILGSPILGRLAYRIGLQRMLRSLLLGLAVTAGLCAASGVAYLGPPAGVFLVRSLSGSAPLGLDSWRWPFALSAVLALCVGIAATWLPPVSAAQPARWPGDVRTHHRNARTGTADGSHPTAHQPGVVRAPDVC